MHKIIRFVENELQNDYSGHDISHIKRVVNNANKIMSVEGGNRKIIITSCYLHDIIDRKLFSNEDEQLNKIYRLLLENNYTHDEINEIIEIIQSISFNEGNYKKLYTLNSMIVRDADRLDAIGSMGIIRCIEYGNSKHRKFYEEKNIQNIDGKLCFSESTDTTLSHFYDKLLKLEELMLTKEGKKLAKSRTKIMKEFLNNFYNELS